MKTILHTVHLTVASLGFPDGALTREIIGSERDRDLFGNSAPFTGGRGRRFGLELCPPEAGPHLGLKYADQPLGERLHIAMKPIPASDGEPRIFVVVHDAKGLSLDAARARADDKWSPDDIFVFCANQNAPHDNL